MLGVKLGMLSCTSALVLAAAAVVAPAASAIPTGSFGDGRQVVIIDGVLEISNLDECWASGFPRDIDVDNRSSRGYLVFASDDCSGAPVATVPARSRETHHGWSARAA